MLGLTGGIGAGKSTVAAMLARRGAVVIDADVLARSALDVGGQAYDAVVRRFGPSVVGPDGGVDRAALAAAVFGDGAGAARDDLNAIVHPIVAAGIALRLASLPNDAVAVVEVPLLVEAGWTADVGEAGWTTDIVVVVDAPEEVAVRRLASERGMDKAEVRRRMAAQASREERRARADVVIDNAGSLEELEAQVERLWDRIEEWADAQDR